MKTALLLCPSWDQMYPAYGPALLAGALRRRGVSSRFHDLNKLFFSSAQSAARDHGREAAMEILAPGEMWRQETFVRTRFAELHAAFIEDAVDRVLVDSPRIAGFSVNLFNAWASIFVARRLKRRAPDVLIVFGGPECFKESRAAELLAAGADAVVLGEADEAFPALVEAVRDGRDLSSVAGVLVKGAWARRAAAVEMDALADPDFDGYDLNAYPNRELTLETSRGCVRKCVFCNDWRQWETFRQKSPEVIARQIEAMLFRYEDARGFFFADSVVNASMTKLLRLSDALEARGGTPWSGYAIVRPEMDFPTLTRLKASGCWNLFYGVESGSDRVLRLMRKGPTQALNARVLRDTRRAGLTNVTFLLVGFPGETEADFRLTLDFLKRNADSIGCLTASLCDVDDMADRWDEFGVDAPAGQTLFWKSRDGENTFPVRVDRFRRLVHAAFEAGVEVHVLRRGDRDSFMYYTERLLGEYYRFLGDSRRASGHERSAAAMLGDWEKGLSLRHASGAA